MEARRGSPRWRRPDRSDPGFGSGPQRVSGHLPARLPRGGRGLDWKITRWLGSGHRVRGRRGPRARRRPGKPLPPGPPRGPLCLARLIASFLDLIDARTPARNRRRPVGGRRRCCCAGPAARARGPTARGLGAGHWRATALGVNLVVGLPAEHVLRDGADGRGAGPVRRRVAGAGRSANLQAQTPADCLQVIHEESGLRQCPSATPTTRAGAAARRPAPRDARRGLSRGHAGPRRTARLPVTGRAVGYVPLLKSVAEQSFRTAPYAISDEVFWVDEGQWHCSPSSCAATGDGPAAAASPWR